MTPLNPYRRSGLTKLAAIALVLASLLNGTGYLLRRVGWLDRAGYHTDLLRFCRQPVQELWLPLSCHFQRILSLDPLRTETIASGRLYLSPGWELVFKLAKYGLIGVFLAISLALLLRGRLPMPRRRQWWPLLPLLISSVLSFLITWGHTGPVLALLSLVTLGWLPMLVLGGWLSDRRQLAMLALPVALLLLAQLPLTLLEAMRGVPIPFGQFSDTALPPALPLPSRLAGSFILPNTLGVALACGLGFLLSYRGASPLWTLSVLVSLPLMLAARSGTGIVVVMALLAWRLLPPLLGLGGLAALAVVLPALLGRADLYWASLVGRLQLLGHVVDVRQPLQALFGHGLAAYSNHLDQLFVEGNDSLTTGVRELTDAASLPFTSTDSMLTLLLVQGGLVAVVAFYGLVLWAIRHDHQARPFLFTVLLASLTINLTEVFPISLLLALSLNRALLSASSAKRSGHETRLTPVSAEGSSPLR